MKAIYLADIYTGMANFESNLSNKCKLLKRGADILEGLLGRLNPDSQSTLCRDAWFQLGNIYELMMSHKIKLIPDDFENHLESNQFSKIVNLCGKSLSSHQSFIAISEEKDERLVRSHFACGTLSKLLAELSPSIDQKPVYHSNSIRYFKEMLRLVRGAKPSIRQRMKEEIFTCEMMLLSLLNME